MMKTQGNQKAAALSRRALLAAGVSGAAMITVGSVIGGEVVKEIEDLLPGEFTWHPERQPDGPVAVVVSIPEQRVHVYRNGIRIAVSTCSTGKPGHTTPTGVFTVLQKDKHHRSSTYGGAPMPNMNRLTWQGIALHAGNLPGYPASHGCVRLPMEFSEMLFGITHIGTPVIIAGAHSDPRELVHPGLLLSGTAEGEMEAAVEALDGKSHPSDWAEGETHPVTTVIASTYDREILLIENDREISRGRLQFEFAGEVGSHVFMLNGSRQQGLVWHAISHQPVPGRPAAPEEELIGRIGADTSFVDAMRRHMHPGMVLVLVDLPLHPDTRSGKDFVVMTG